MAALASVISALAFSAGSAAGQQPGDIPGRCVDPPSTRRSEIGCYLLSNERVDTVPAGPLYWHLYSYPTRAAAESASAVGGGQDVVTGVVVEVIFVYPGMGQYLVDHVTKRDVPVVQAVGLIFASVYVTLNIIADIAAIVANQRLRHPK